MSHENQVKRRNCRFCASLTWRSAFCYTTHAIESAPDTSLSADLSGPSGTVVRLGHCIVTNRTGVAYPQNGIRYVLEGMADLSLPNLSNENRRRYIEPFDGAYNRVKFGKGAQFEMSEQDMLNLER